MSDDLGRLHVHLYELKEPFKEKTGGHPHISNVTRYLINAYLEESLMILSKEVLDVIDKGDFNAAVELMLPGLQKLREERLQAGERKKAAKKKSAAARGKKKAGIKTEKEKQADKMLETLMGGFK
ncbi:MAG: hypothetical protein ACXABD_18685 [Candidatus Thorarchaeota archaeon]|jgi:hypothetical protein